MRNADFYLKLYELLGPAAPLGYDCGRLCNRACCAVSPGLPGMYLFPGEEALFEGVEDFTISSRVLPGYGSVPLLSCRGVCNRDLRPLSCRLFPLAPAVRGNRIVAVPDPRGRAVCPLCLEPKAALSRQFVLAVQAVFDRLMALEDGARFLTALAAYVDEYWKPL